MTKNINKPALLIIILISIVAIIAMFFIKPIAQDASYHNFNDVREILQLANFWNVMSNLPFILVGLLGLYELLVSQKLQIIKQMKWAYATFFTGVAFVALGSGYYHLDPNNNTLLWDRLPMTIAFMALFSLVIAEHISVKIAKILLLPFLILGLSSVLYWSFTESNGAGDLRPYVLVQFLPMLIIPLILLKFTSLYSSCAGYWWLLASYLIAKLFEYFDAQIFTLLPLSGHSLKHIAAAMGIYFLLQLYKQRLPLKIQANN